MPLDEFVNALAEAGLSSILDPNPVRFTRTHRQGVSPLLGIIASGPVLEARLSRRLLRNQFLFGCKAAVESERLEHLIVGYGAKRSSGTDIWKVSHLVGTEDQVAIPQILQQSMDNHLGAVHNAEVLVVHSHPRWWANELLKNRPVASRTDRDTLMRQRYGNARSLWRVLTNSGGIRLFLCENGMVRQIVAPSLATAANWLGSR